MRSPPPHSLPCSVNLSIGHNSSISLIVIITIFYLQEQIDSFLTTLTSVLFLRFWLLRRVANVLASKKCMVIDISLIPMPFLPRFRKNRGSHCSGLKQVVIQTSQYSPFLYPTQRLLYKPLCLPLWKWFLFFKGLLSRREKNGPPPRTLVVKCQQCSAVRNHAQSLSCKLYYK